MMDEFEGVSFGAGRTFAASAVGEHAAAAWSKGKATEGMVAHPDQRLSIRTLGGFDIRRNGYSLLASGRLPRRPIALLLLLVAGGAQGSRREALVERLWPGEDGADASRLKVAIHRLRRLIGDSAAILSHANTLRINPDRVCVDAWEVEHLTGADMEPEAACRRALQLYAGSFVADIAADPALLIYQQHIEGRFEAAVLSGARALADAGNEREALEYALQGLMRMQSGGNLLHMARELASRMGSTAQSAALEAFSAALDGDGSS